MNFQELCFFLISNTYNDNYGLKLPEPDSIFEVIILV